MNSSQWIVLIFGLLYFGLILFTRKKGNFEEFSVAGRSLGFFLIFSSICASYIGPGWTLGLTRAGFTSGMFMAYLVPLCGLGLIIVGTFLVPSIRNKFTDIYSMGDLVGGEKSHNHKAVQVAGGIASLLFIGALTVAMSYAGGELINNVFGFSKTWSIIIVTTIVILYSYFGGIRATIQTDAIQFVHFIILIPILVLLMILHSDFSWQEYSALTTLETSKEFDTQPTTAILGMAMLWLLSASGLESTGLSRFLASGTNRVARNAAIASGLFMAFWFVLMVFIGSAGHYMYPALTNDDQVLLHIAAENFPGILNGVFIIAMIGVVMSSQDTVLNAGSVLFSEDLIGTLIPITENQKLRIAKLYTILMGVICIMTAIYLSSILGIIMTVTEYYLPVMIPVVIFSILKKTCYWQSAIVAMAVGFISYILWKLFYSDIMPELFAALSLSTLSYLISDYVLINRIRK